VPQRFSGFFANENQIQLKKDFLIFRQRGKFADIRLFLRNVATGVALFGKKRFKNKNKGGQDGERQQ